MKQVNTDKKMEDFEKATRPLIKWLNDNCPNPHTSIIITPTNAELVEGIMSTGKILDYLKD